MHKRAQGRAASIRQEKRTRLTADGWRLGSAGELLGLSAAESAFVEMKVALALELKRRRAKQQLTQSDVAKLVESSQSRVAKMEAADALVSIDLLVRALLALGATRREIARALGSSRS